MTAHGTRRLTACALLAAAAILMGWLERLIPFDLGVPGMRLGLSNLIIVLALYGLGARAALAVNVTRIAVAGLLFSGLSGMLFSLAGGLLGFFSMWLCRRAGCFSIAGVSMAGGAAHNVGQLLVALPLMGSGALLYLLPALILSGAVSGALVGIVAALCLPALRRALPKR